MENKTIEELQLIINKAQSELRKITNVKSFSMAQSYFLKPKNTKKLLNSKLLPVEKQSSYNEKIIQSLGEFDKFGNEIFELDVFGLKYEAPIGYHNGEYVIDYIEWNAFKFVHKKRILDENFNFKKQLSYELSKKRLNNMKIIGNILTLKKEDLEGLGK